MLEPLFLLQNILLPLSVLACLLRVILPDALLAPLTAQGCSIKYDAAKANLGHPLGPGIL